MEWRLSVAHKLSYGFVKKQQHKLTELFESTPCFSGFLYKKNVKKGLRTRLQH